MAVHPQSSRTPAAQRTNPEWVDARPDRPLPTVQLRHDLPDGTWHVDWMIARDPEGAEPLITFRLPRPLAALAPGDPGMPAQRLDDHRPAYLEYEGEVPGGRGRVSRLARGMVIQSSTAADRRSVTVVWSDAGGPGGVSPPVGYELVTQREGRLLISIVSAAGASPR